MTDYHVRPVNGDDSNGGTGPDNAWKTFFSPASGGQGGTFNCAQVTDGDRVFLWAEGSTGGEFLGTNPFNWFWPLENGNVCFIGVNENGVEDGTRYIIYTPAEWESFRINSYPASSFSAYYPELTIEVEGKAPYIMLLKNIRLAESKVLDPTLYGSNDSPRIGSYMDHSRVIMYNCEIGPMTGNASSLPYNDRFGGDIALINCYFHDDNSTRDATMPDPLIIGCVFDNLTSVIDWEMYGGGVIMNNVFSNHQGNVVIKLDETSGNENSFNVIANNVFYNNNGTCIQTFDDQSLSKIFIYNNIFDSNGSVIDLNSITHTYSSAGGDKNILLNNTNTVINGGSSTIEDVFTIGFGVGGSGGIGTTAGVLNYYSGTIDYRSTTGTGDFRVKTTSSLDQLGLLNTTAGLGLAPFDATLIPDSNSLSLSQGDLGDTVVVSNKRYQKVNESPIVWRRVRSGQSFVAEPYSTLFIHDRFDGSGTIVSRTPDTVDNGNSWSVPEASVSINVTSGYAYRSSKGSGSSPDPYYDSAIIDLGTSAPFKIEALIKSTTQGQGIVLWNTDGSGANSETHLSCRLYNNNLNLIEIISGVEQTALAYQVVSISTGTAYLMRVLYDGTTVTLSLYDSTGTTLVGEVSSSSYAVTPNTKVGIHFGGSSTGSGDKQIYDFKVYV